MKYLGDGIYEMGDGTYAVKSYVKGKGWTYEAKEVKTGDLSSLKKLQKAKKNKVMNKKMNNYPYVTTEKKKSKDK